MKKTRNKSLRDLYIIFMEVGIIFSLLFFIAATNIDTGTKKQSQINQQVNIDPEVLVEIPPTNIPEKLPPQKPMIVNPKPDDALIDDIILEFPEFGDFNQNILLPPDPADETKEEIVTFLPIMPSIIGGQNALYSKLEYPELPRKAGIQGKVIVEFVIDKEGNVTQPKIVRSVHPDLDEEVLRVIKLIKFSPGVQNGTLVKVRMTQMINFKLKR